MKQNNRFNKFNRNNQIEKQILCTCGDIAKLVSHKNYPFGKKSKVMVSQYYKCNKCGKISFVKKQQKGGRK